ncbi:MAG: cobyrinic acid a,c-diamide synthase [Deltaproteobacteria bacterium]|nr:MAG: cobyrinic acid a,c-diamide synthase [Deltaproteobacteria bacterium]
MAVPRFMISALRGGSGKTVLSIGLIAVLKDQGYAIAPFKKGPDYIDAGWLALAADRPCYNLDTFLCHSTDVIDSFHRHTRSDDIAVIEGNRGLFDGIDLAGETSTAELAKLINAPVILCLDCTKSTRTVAATVLGCLHFDTDVPIAGVVLNRVAGPRHEQILRNSIEHHCGIPVVGAIGKLKKKDFPERHMGLVPTAEHQWAQQSVSAAAAVVKQHVDLDAVLRIAREKMLLSQASPGPEMARVMPGSDTVQVSGKSESVHRSSPLSPVRIGIVRDSAFQFYYPDNLEALEDAGAEVIYLSPLSMDSLPDLDGLYLGGGFPETHVEALSDNVGFHQSIRRLAEKGFPIYAECGGLMYLGRAIVIDGTSYPMVGLLPIEYGLSKRPQGHGYTVLRVERENPYFPVGSVIKGHEFHYSSVSAWQGQAENLVFSMERGTGFTERRDGVRYKNVLALYTHIHALGTPQWAFAMVRCALKWREEKTGRE